MKWNQEKPTVPGIYLAYIREGDDFYQVLPVYVRRVSEPEFERVEYRVMSPVRVNGWTAHVPSYVWFCGPIEVPELPKEASNG